MAKEMILCVNSHSSDGSCDCCHKMIPSISGGAKNKAVRDWNHPDSCEICLEITSSMKKTPYPGDSSRSDLGRTRFPALLMKKIRV